MSWKVKMFKLTRLPLLISPKLLTLQDQWNLRVKEESTCHHYQRWWRRNGGGVFELHARLVSVLLTAVGNRMLGQMQITLV